MLFYHERIVENLIRSPGGCLAVIGRGLGLHNVLLELVRRALDDGNADGRHATHLVFLINTPQEEVELLLQRAELEPRWAKSLGRFTAVSSDMSVEERAAAFARGGVFAVSARLLVPDLLAGRVLPEAVSGLIVNHAHSVNELSADAFVLRLCRSGATRGFLWALSDRPENFARNQAEADKIIQRCYAQNLEVWPRIRKEIQGCLQGDSQPDVIQRTLTLPPCVAKIQRHILNIIESCLEELRKDPNLNLGHLGLRESLFQSFEAELRQAIDPVRMSLGPRTRQMSQDLSSVRKLLLSLLRCDAVEFHALLEGITGAGAEQDRRDMPAWLFSPDAQALTELAKARVYQMGHPSGLSVQAVGGSAASEVQLRRTLEPHAKWQVLLDIIDKTIQEVAASISPPDMLRTESGGAVAEKLHVEAPDTATPPSKGGSQDDSGSDIEIVSVIKAKRPRLSEEPAKSVPTVAAGGVIEPRLLVVVPDDRVKRQINSVLTRGSEASLLDALHSYLKDKFLNGSVARQRQGQETAMMNHLNRPPHSGAGPHGAGRINSHAEATLLRREMHTVATELTELAASSVLHLRQLPDGRPCHPRVDVVSAEGPDGIFELRLREAQPHAVVLYEPSLESIRAIEVFCAETARAPRFGFHAVKREPGTLAPEEGQEDVGCVHEKVCATLKTYLLVFDDSIENYTFRQDLVRESEAVDGLIKARQHLTVRADRGGAELPAAAELSSTRRGGGSRGTLDALLKRKIVVDQREFRSVLPFMLHLRSLTIDPVTIPVGDYILSRDICVERKAIPDLIQSFASGRLHQQAQNMCKHYSNPSLLIEFDPGKSFALQNTYTIAKRDINMSTRDLLGKIALLVLHFSQLRLIWSPSQRFTADIFLRLKEGRHEPDPKSAAQVDAEDLGEETSGPSAASGDGSSTTGVQRRLPRTNTAAFEVLRKLPGVSPRNMHTLARRGKSLAGLAEMPLGVLTEIMGEGPAQQLHDFLHKEVTSPGAAPGAAASEVALAA
mmetsp:Transcript_10571/g.17665  ORF Transcript_10571/g.17665 Transcript_10571/m.17665 type:complete len:1008 (+) Transcript_10571:72-3095(+)